MNDIKPGDCVIVASGPHFLQHGIVQQGIASELTQSKMQPAPPGFAVVRFVSSSGRELNRANVEGEPMDMINLKRLALCLSVQQQNQVGDILGQKDAKRKIKRAAADEFARSCLLGTGGSGA